MNHNHVFQVNSQQVMPQFTKVWLQLCPCNLKNTITDRCVPIRKACTVVKM